MISRANNCDVGKLFIAKPSKTKKILSSSHSDWQKPDETALNQPAGRLFALIIKPAIKHGVVLKKGVYYGI